MKAARPIRNKNSFLQSRRSIARCKMYGEGVFRKLSFSLRLSPECAGDARMQVCQDTVRGLIRRLWGGVPGAACFRGLSRLHKLQRWLENYRELEDIRRRTRNRMFGPNGDLPQRRWTRDGRAIAGARKNPKVGEALTPNQRGGRSINSSGSGTCG